MTYSEDEQTYKKLSYYKTKPIVICNKTNKKTKPRIAATEKSYPAQDDTDDVLKQSITPPKCNEDMPSQTYLIM